MMVMIKSCDHRLCHAISRDGMEVLLLFPRTVYLGVVVGVFNMKFSVVDTYNRACITMIR